MSITLHIKDSNGIVKTAKINPANKQALHIKALSGVNYQLINDATHFAPENLTISRTGNDLHVAFEGSNIKQPDLIIEGYYEESGDNLLVGQHENGNYYPYVPESGQRAEVVTLLAEQQASGQALGGTSFVTPVVSTFDYSWLLLPVAIIGGAFVIAKLAGDDDDDSDDSSAETQARVVHEADTISPDGYESFSDKQISLGNDNNTVNIHSNFSDGELSMGAGNDSVFIGESFGSADLSSLVQLGAGDDNINLSFITNDGQGSRLIDGGVGTDVLTFTGSGHTSDLQTANVEQIHFTGSDNELNISLDMLLSDDINTLYFNNVEGAHNNIIDLGDNNNGASEVDLGDFALTQQNVSATDALGETHTYNVYTGGVDATETLYIDTGFIVI